jgi:hypothetical protein
MRFAQAIESYDEDDLPWRLTGRREHGLRRIMEVTQLGGVNATLLMLRTLTQINDPKFDVALGMCWRKLLDALNLLEVRPWPVHFLPSLLTR